MSKEDVRARISEKLAHLENKPWTSTQQELTEAIADAVADEISRLEERLKKVAKTARDARVFGPARF